MVLCVYLDLVLSGYFIWSKAGCSRLTLGVRHPIEHGASGREGAARARLGKRKNNQRPRDRPMIFIFHLHDRLSRGLLFDIVESPFTIEYCDLQLRRGWGLGIQPGLTRQS